MADADRSLPGRNHEPEIAVPVATALESAGARTHFFADHNAARCPFVSLVVPFAVSKLIRGSIRMKNPNRDLDSWPDPASSNAAAAFSLRTLSSKAMPTPVDRSRSKATSLAHCERQRSSWLAQVALMVSSSPTGTVSGAISARHVQLAPGAVVQADVIHERIAIEAGAELEGKLQRKA